MQGTLEKTPSGGYVSKGGGYDEWVKKEEAKKLAQQKFHEEQMTKVGDADIPPPEIRPQGKNYRVEAKRVILQAKIKAESDFYEKWKGKVGLEEHLKTIKDTIESDKVKLANIEQDDPKDLPFIPMGKNTHTKSTNGFLHNKTDIKIQTGIADDSLINMLNERLKGMWNILPDDVRDKVKTFKIQKSKGRQSFRGGSFDEWSGTLIININRSSPIEHHFYHEVGHILYDNIKREHPEKAEKWVKEMQKITIAPTKYAQSYMDFGAKNKAKADRFIKDRERRGIPLTTFEKERLEKNEYVSKDLYENEIHSEINAYAMGWLPTDTMKYSREFTNKYLTAYKELHEI